MAPNLTVAENVTLGTEPRRGLRRLDRRAARAEAEQVLQRVGAHFSPEARVGDLSTGEQQLIEIGRALALHPRVLILDEPTAALALQEAERLAAIVRGLRDEGIAVVYITHRMEEITALADRVTVLRDGCYVETMDRAAATPDAIVTRMVGRPIEQLYDLERPAPGAPRLEVRGLTDGAGIGPVDLTLRAGEIVGVAGLIGSGRSEIARLIFGADPATGGELRVDGTPVTVGSPAEAMAAGIALVPESRKTEGLHLQLSVADNIAMAGLAGLSRRGVLDRPRIRATADDYRERLRIRIASSRQVVDELSGGNQQKVLLAKWLLTDPGVLILDEPTRGVDVGAKAEIYRLMNDVAAKGLAVLFISSELPEVLGMSDRVLVVRGGRIAAELPGGSGLTEEDVMRHATGLGTGESVEPDSADQQMPTEVPSR
jgi:ABC-type sugar transport system ATPase subunit